MNTKANNSLLWWVAGAFSVLLIAWAVLFMVAAKHPVPEVPLVKQPS